MAIMTRDRESGGGFGLTKHTVGNALVVYPTGNMTKAAQDLALTVAQDTENDLVVVDLPASSPLSWWESVAQVLPKRRRGVRLVIGGRSRETTALAGHWMAERLKRTVLVPDGPVLCGAGGSLFVHSGPNSGWVRCTPGKPPKFEAKRFPRPVWDADLVAENFPTSARGIAEPMPSGVWIRPMGDDPQLRANRQRLIEVMPCQPEHLSVVLGSPGGVPLGQDDVALLWRQLPENLRERARFIQYGPMSVPRSQLGQTIADALGHEVVFYTGMPIGPAVAPEIFTVRPDGTLGWHAYAREIKYQPRISNVEPPRVPTVVTHRAPVPGGVQLAPGVYHYSVDAVVEVVQSGLLVRPPAATANVDAIRLIPADPVTHNLMYEAENDADLARMEYLAADLSQRLGNSVRPMSRVLHARSLLDAQARPTTSQAARGVADAESSAEVFTPGTSTPDAVPPAPGGMPAAISAVAAPTAQLTDEYAVPRWSRPGGSEGHGDAGRPAAPNGAPGVVPTGPPPVAPAPDARSPHVVPPVIASDADAFGDPVPLPGPGGAGPAAPRAPRPAVAPPPVQPGLIVPEVTGPAVPQAPRPAVAPPSLQARSIVPGAAGPAEEPTREGAAGTGNTASTGDADVGDANGHGADPGGPRPVEAAAPAIARRQPVPSPEAAGLLPGSGIDDERAWLRRTLGAEYGVLSNSVARILSQHPGFQGALSSSSAEVLTDAVAVQLFLTDRGKAVDSALRTAAVGPHVPFARCVVAGLSRLPSHRGPVVFTASPTPGQWDLYRDHKLFTEWGFLHALTGPPADGDGEVDVLVWSMTARRTKLLEPDNGAPERVLFVPGTNFKVLEMTGPQADGGRGHILLRELTAVEIDAEGRVDPNRISLDELALNSLHRQVERWRSSSPSVQLNRAFADRFGALPGLA
ncbi:hypothetical protein [Lentzea jiangxiensis]|uniref:Uncharacterized protein n=1 Tax=Lentzea jiangxiensis TaxID=641025 RepID=A0A1H0SK71_9PSEU|nr:hypothetical protein [Lentzea jiangxiensis]SDP42065.1 hypothetical protein SAMN05421507_108115 [Lentzea jiangxiensis]